MARYGLDYYSASTFPLSYYGSDNPLNYDASPVTTLSSGYAKITIKWVTPIGNWAKMKIVRSPYGFPVNFTDGEVAFETTRRSDPQVYTDVLPDTKNTKTYYYSIFVLDVTQLTWVLAGRAEGLSVKNYGTGDLLYNYMPLIHKITTPNIASEPSDNEDLFAFLSLFGFGFDKIRGLIDLVSDRYNFEKVTGVTIPLILNQVGIASEPEIGYQQSRILVRDSVQLTKEKGSGQGVREYIKSFSGWACPAPVSGTPNPTLNGLQVSHNLMLSYNDSSLEENVGNWVSGDSTGSLRQLGTLTVTKYQTNNNNLRLIVGGHGYRVGDKIIVTLTCGSGSPVQLGVPVNSGDTYTFSVYSAALSTARSFTAGISWYDRFGVFMSTSTGSPVTNATGSLSTRGTVSAAAPAAITLNPFFGTAGSGYTDGVYTNVPLTRVSGKVFSIAPLANIAISGGVVQTCVITNGGKGSDPTTVYSFDKASISSPGGSGFLVTVARVQECYYAAPTITISNVANAASGERHYFDAAQFEKAEAVTDFDEARQIHITMKATRINEIKNPTFNSASSFAPWGFTNGTATATSNETDPIADVFSIEGYQQSATTATVTLSTVHTYKIGDIVLVSGLPSPYSGVKTITGVQDFTFDYTVSPSASVIFTQASGSVAKTGNACIINKTATGNTEVRAAATSVNYLNVHYPSTYYTFSVYVKRITGTTAPTIRPVIYWYDNTNTAISSTLEPLVTINSSTSWQRISSSAVAPANAAYANVSFIWTNGEANDQIAVDDALFENSPFSLQYFDGNQGFGSTAELFWEGQVPNNSRSHYYKNYVAVSERLAAGALDEWVTYGSTYALYLAQPKT